MKRLQAIRPPTNTRNLTGDAALMMQGVKAITDIRAAQEASGNTDEFGFTHYAWSDDQSKNFLSANGDTMMCSASTKHPEAETFLQYMLTKEAGTIWNGIYGNNQCGLGCKLSRIRSFDDGNGSSFR